MIVINRAVLFEFTRKHADAMKPAAKWIQEVENAQWESFIDVKNIFHSVDYIGNDHVVFNLKGNNYRFITIVIFEDVVINIRWAGTHSEYDKIKDCSIL